MGEIDYYGPIKPLVDNYLAAEAAQDAADSNSGGLTREDFEFGGGSFVGTVMRNQEYFDMPAEDRARILGWVAGCPVPEELLEARDPQALEERYGQIAYAWRNFIVKGVEKQNPDLAAELLSAERRHPEEPVGRHEPESVPESYTTEMAPIATLPGFGLPRLFIEQAGMGKKLSFEDANKRLLSAQAMLDEAALEAQDPLELLLSYAEKVHDRGDVDPQTVFKYLLPTGWLEENNGERAIDRLKRQMLDWSDAMATDYRELWDFERRQLGIA